jgi:hypothetical protein
MEVQPDYLTSTEASAEFDTSGSYLIRLVKEGTIEGYKRGPIWFINRASIKDWKANHRGRGGSEKGVAWSKKKAAEAASAPAPPIAGDTQPAAQQETIIDAEGAHIRIEALRPDGQRWLEAEAHAGDMQATIYLRPYGALASVYTLEKRYDRADPQAPGRIGYRQEQRGKALVALLEKHLRAALQAAGWHTEDRAGNELWRYQPRRSGSAE